MLLDASLDAGPPFLTVREYPSADELPPAFIVLRHDVDREPKNALDFARIEADRGVASTYYVRTVEKTFDRELVREIESLGHEIGYHYEDMDRVDGDGALKVKDRTFGVDGGKQQASTPLELVDRLRTTPDGRFRLLLHPDRWAGSPLERVTETAFDTAENVSKYAMHVVSGRGG